MFLWKEDRRLSGNLTLHYKRMLYLVEPSAEAKRLRGKRVQVCESEDGTVRITYRGAELAARAFAKDGAVTQATVVENKPLGGALEEIRQKQLVRDTQKLRSRSMNRRDKTALSRSIEARLGDRESTGDGRVV